MSKVEKSIAKFLKVPNYLTWEELVKILNHKGYYEKLGKGKNRWISNKIGQLEYCYYKFTQPHPKNIVKQYVIRQILEKWDF